MSNINSRIREIRDVLFSKEKAKHQTFSDVVGVKQNQASNWMKDGSSVGNSVIEQILKAFPTINANWLITGDGEMMTTTEKLNHSNKKGVPYFEDVEATGSIISCYDDFKEIPTFYIDYAHFNDCDAYLNVVGDSMYPKYCSGEIIAVKKMNNLDALLPGEAHLVVTNSNANNLRTIKLIFPDDDRSKLILRASNPSYKGDMIINKSDIISIFIVKGKITRNQL